MPAAPWPTGCVQIYTGDGKGKTTAAFGLALRAAGRGLRVWVGQFMKGTPYGEVAACSALPGIAVEQLGSTGHLTRGEAVPPAERALALAGLSRAAEVLADGLTRVVILDELCVALFYDLVLREEVEALLDTRPAGVELVLTGRYAPDWLLARADLVTVMGEARHPWRVGLAARDGIER
ncbi:MAG: cob(I)yrinic acid a,c-diamide adenosyltransferase [Deltaproteobacteria bacterium]|nr:cob(I)yrinic acid a,c-diamide adenosyltransferase [Deltaproteobacteria bacterium]